MAKNVKAGGAYYDLSVRNKLAQGLAKARARLKSFAKAGVAVFKGVAVAGAALGAAFVLATVKAAAFQKTLSKFNTVFQHNTAEVQAWGEKFGKEIGISKNNVLSFLASTQDLLVPLGVDPATAIESSKQITMLAADLASFNNIPTADALNDIQSALTGSGKVMKKYGVVLNEASLSQALLNQGLDPSKATEAQKAMARLSVIVKGTTAAQGDAIRTGDTFANQFGRLKASFDDFLVSIGGPFLDFLAGFVSQGADAINLATEWTESIANAFKGGSIELAGEIAFTTLKLVIANILAEIAGFFGDTLDTLLQGLGELSKRIAGVMAKLNSARVSGVNFLSGIIGAAVGVDTSPEQALATQQAKAFAGAMKDFQSRDIGAELQQAFDPTALTERLNALKQEAKDLADAASGPVVSPSAQVPEEPVAVAAQKAQAAAAALGSFSVGDLNQRAGKDINRDILKENKDQTEQLKIIAKLLPGLSLSYGP